MVSLLAVVFACHSELHPPGSRAAARDVRRRHGRGALLDSSAGRSRPASRRPSQDATTKATQRAETHSPMMKMVESDNMSAAPPGLRERAEGEDGRHPDAHEHPSLPLSAEPEVDGEQERDERGCQDEVVA